MLSLTIKLHNHSAIAFSILFVFNFSHFSLIVQRGIFTALHGMQRGLNDEISVRLSVCLSVKRVPVSYTHLTLPTILRV